VLLGYRGDVLTHFDASQLQYATVALYNFLSSTCQFQALKVVSL